jgi:disulfide bond formation protein DsbB
MTKQELIPLLNSTLATASLIAFFALIILAASIFYYEKKGKTPAFFSFIKKNFFLIGTLSSLGSIFITLFYSDYLGFLPCGLCWFQRVFSYPLFFIFLVAWRKKDFGVTVYVKALSIIGFIVALYHEYLQLGYSELIPCPTIASTVDCAKPTFIEYGFVTFPFMSIVLFMFFFILSFLVEKTKEESR